MCVCVSCCAQIVGYEGLFGVIGTLGIMAPIAYFLPGVEGEGVHENIVDTMTVCLWLMFGHMDSSQAHGLV